MYYIRCHQCVIIKSSDRTEKVKGVNKPIARRNLFFFIWTQIFIHPNITSYAMNRRALSSFHKLTRYLRGNYNIYIYILFAI